jgi:hypothetical protein
MKPVTKEKIPSVIVSRAFEGSVTCTGKSSQKPRSLFAAMSSRSPRLSTREEIKQVVTSLSAGIRAMPTRQTNSSNDAVVRPKQKRVSTALDVG